MLLLTASFNSFATVLYQTSFETTQGYSTNSELVGQNGWLGAGSGGNGILADVFSAKGQQGYVGITPPLPGDSSLYVYQPINKNVAHAEFSVLMSVFDSTNTNFDDFYWVVFNQQSDPLFILDFDNYELKVYYWLEGATNRTWSASTSPMRSSIR